jgi:hypothetical protein
MVLSVSTLNFPAVRNIKKKKKVLIENIAKNK